MRPEHCVRLDWLFVPVLVSSMDKPPSPYVTTGDAREAGSLQSGQS